MLEPTEKDSLIKFVLKTRLSSAAKLKLESNYATVIQGITSNLLTNKTDTALQVQLSRAAQGKKSISDFGAELEKLFVDLTISQANGNKDAYSILKPINEKNAIKRFADGLNSTRLSTIVTARNFTKLKDAIQLAVDEDSTRPTSSSTGQQIFSISRNRGRRYNNSYRGNNNFRGRSQRHFYSNSRGRTNYSQSQHGTAYRHPSRGNAIGNRGRSGTNTTRYYVPRERQYSNQRIMLANDTPQNTSENSTENNWFFRSSQS